MTAPHHIRALVAKRFEQLPRADLEAWVAQLLTHHQEVQHWLTNHECRSPLRPKSNATHPRSTP